MAEKNPEELRHTTEEQPPTNIQRRSDCQTPKLPSLGQLIPTGSDVKSHLPPKAPASQTCGDAVAKGDGILDGRYQLCEQLGKGGMGAVYQGKHILMDKTVAVKVIHQELAHFESIAKRFEREAKSASRLTDPHCINVTDFGRTGNGALFLVMEYLPGETLKERLKKESPLPLEKAIRITKHILKALDHAHEAGVVHRDLKPDNVMLVTHGDENDFAKVFDFGIAKMASGDEDGELLTQAGLVLGTPSYMSPEQGTGKKIDHRADLYAVGVMLFEMLAGFRPFQGSSLMDVIYAHVSAPIPSLPKTCPAPQGLDEIIKKALSKKPDSRFRSARDFLAALEAIDMTAKRHRASLYEIAQVFFPLRNLFAQVVSRRLYHIPTSIRQGLEHLEASRLVDMTHPIKIRNATLTPKRRRVFLTGLIVVAIIGLSAFVAKWQSRNTTYVTTKSAISVAKKTRGPNDAKNANGDNASAELEIDRKNLSPVIEMASEQIRGGMPKTATATLRRVLRLEPDHSIAQLLLGHALYLRGDRLGATKSYARALELDPSLSDDPLLEEHLTQALKHPKPRENAASILIEYLGSKGIDILAAQANAAEIPGDERAFARQLLVQNNQGESIDWVESLGADFREYTSCGKRREIVAQMIEFGDPGFLPILKEELRHPTTSPVISRAPLLSPSPFRSTRSATKRRKISCGIRADIQKAIHSLDKSSFRFK